MPHDHDRTFSSAAPAAGPVAVPTRGRAYGERFGQTERTDAWWLKPAAQAAGLALLGLYATWAALQGRHYEYGNYLSPFYSPLIRPAWLPEWTSPAVLILWAPGAFRATCYYYRRAYYRIFFLDPVACAVGEPRAKGYRGEAKFPFILQNAHRFFFIVTLFFLPILWWDVFKAFTRDGHFVVGGGSFAILASTSLLTLYSLSCHSLRHLIGGRLDCFSCVVAGGPRKQSWDFVSRLNEHHMGFAWWSLLGVCFADFYVRMCSMGVFHDPVWTFTKTLQAPWPQ
jgi:hypothetical protein